jgi:formylglycine-generating enzyme required for sulfatase activity/predicted Ser/Thr protein kinase
MVDEWPGTIGADGAQWIGPYRVLELIGDGGMGVVYLAERREPVPQRVALKVIRRDRVDSQYRARFELEQQAMARMDHPNIARIYESGITAGGMPWFAMEYVPGPPLGEYCDERRLPLAERLELFRQVCDGVQHAHMKGILHRDLKPSNVLVREVDDRPVAKIIDFGLARPVDPLQQRLTLHEELRRIIGTLAYMSPEQAGLTAEDVDTRTDVYSLGVMLYELMTGQLPFDVDVLEKVGPLNLPSYLRKAEPKKPSTRLSDLGDAIAHLAELRGLPPNRLRSVVTGDLDWITMKALEKDRRRRYATARDLGRDLERFLAHEPVEAGPPGAGYRLRKWVRRHRVVVASAFLVGTTLAAAAAVSTSLYWEAQRAHARTREALREQLLDADTYAIGALVDGAERLWPARSDRLDAMARWLQDAADVLTRRAEHAARLRLVESQWREGLEGTVSPVERLRRTAVRDRAARAVEDLSRLAGDGGLVTVVESRRAVASRCRAESIESRTGAWNAAAERLQQLDPRSRLTPVEGIVPLGVDDAANGLPLFYVYGTGNAPLVEEGRVRPRLGDAVVLLLLPGGSFRLGSQRDDWPAEDRDGKLSAAALEPESPCRTVEMAPFLLAKYELTQDQWIRMGGTNISQCRPMAGEAPDALLRPVDNVSWDDCRTVLRRYGLCFPTEAQWEYACKAGRDHQWPGEGPKSLPQFAHFQGVTLAGQSADKTWIAGSLAANAWGLHDMLGNVWEWCLEGYTNTYAGGSLPGDGHLVSDPADGGQPVDVRRAALKVVRGGSYRSIADDVRAAKRQAINRVNRHPTYGVRPCVRLDGRDPLDW